MKIYNSIHNHTYYSLLDGINRPTAMAKAAKEMGMTAIGITDHGTMAGIPEFVTGCKDAGIKPMIGIEAYMVPDRHKHEVLDSPSGRKMRTGYHLILLAKNLVGYKNLIRLNNVANSEGFYYSPKIDWEILMECREGLIVSSACPSGELGQYALSEENPKTVAAKFKEVFGDDYYIEVMDNNMRIELQRTINKRLIPLAKSMGIKVVPTNDAHYLKAEDSEIHDVAVCMQSKKLLSDPNRLRYDGIYHLKNMGEMAQIFPDFMINTEEVAEKIEEFNIFTKEMHLPKLADDPDVVLKMMADGGLIKRGLTSQPYKERLKKELGVIQKLKMASYMLTTADLIGIIQSAECPIGWGRGSGGGSLLCYALGITDIDPIKYDLHFERFLSEYRGDWPDIDLDIAQNKRAEVIDAIIQKYGEQNVAHITTYSSLKPKMLIRDICRIKEESVDTANKLSRMIPEKAEKYQDLKDSEIEQTLQSNSQGRAVLKTLEGLMGLPRHAGVHASGIVISPFPLIDSMPMRREKDKNVIQYTYQYMDKFGFLKFDVLGVTKLDIINQSAKDAGIDIKDIPDNDPKVFQLIGNGQVEGMFQLDASKSCMKLCKQMKPVSILEIADLIALHRPAVMEAGLLDVYLNRRNGIEPVTYPHPDLKPILEREFGVCIYQEDIMNMAKIFAGFTLGEAEELRYGIAKKKPDVIARMKPLFETKAKALNRSETEITKIMEQIEASQNYGFNKSHSVGYAHVTYASAYLLANYPLEFFKNLINLSKDDDRPGYLSAAMIRKIRILPPDINRSSKEVTIENGAIRLGLMSMKGIGNSHADKIIEKRPFKTMQDVHNGITKSALAILHSAHALESVADAHTYSPLVKADEIQILGISLSGMVDEYKDVIDAVDAVPFAELEDSGTSVIKVTDVKVIKDRNKKDMAFLSAIDVHGPKIDRLIMFASAYNDEDNIQPKKNGVYVVFLARLGDGGFQIKFMRDVEGVRKKHEKVASK